jgi:putative transposase
MRRHYASFCNKMVRRAAKREAVAHLQAAMGLSERPACIIVAADRTTIRYWSRRPPELELREKLRDLASRRRRFGYRRLFVLLRDEGEASAINRIYRIYREKGPTVRKRRARRRAVGTGTPILVESRAKVRSLIAEWVTDYNEVRPHSSLGYRTRAAFAAVLTTKGSQLRNSAQLRRESVAHHAPIGVSETSETPGATG